MQPLLLALTALATGGTLPTSPGPARPNVLVLYADDLRPDALAALGNPDVETPRLDRLMAEGTAFTRVRCMGSPHGAVCVPSRAMLLTGRSLFRCDQALKEPDSWPERFAAAGYTVPALMREIMASDLFRYAGELQ